MSVNLQTRKIGMLFMALAGLLFIVNTFFYVMKHVTPIEYVTSPAIWQNFLVLIVMALTAWYPGKASRFIQVAAIWFVGTVMAQDTGSMQYLSLVTYGGGLVLAYKYDMLQKHMIAKVIAAVLWAATSLIISGSVQDFYIRLIDMLVFIAFGIIFIYVLFESELQILKKRMIIMDQQRGMAENLDGVLHSFKALTASMVSSTDRILEGDMDYLELLSLATEELRSRVLEVNNFQKNSVIDSKVEFDVLPVIQSIVRIFQVGVAAVITVEGESFMLTANVSNFKIAIENAIRNAVEVLPNGGKVTIIVRGGLITVADTGPGIPCCITCHETHKCNTCSQFRYGKTSKPNGSGFGMRNLMDFVDSNAWRLQVSAIQNIGTTIRIDTVKRQEGFTWEKRKP
jgi:signal transduction histidine kinase